MILWVTGLLTLVPGSTYYLLVHAQRSEYALLIVLVLFWIFGFWGVAGPLLSALKIRRLFKTFAQCRSADDVARLFQHQTNEETVIEMIAGENKIPKFLARLLYQQVIAKLKRQGQEG